MVSMWSLRALLLLFATAARQEGACPMEMWVFQNRNECGGDQATADATIYADNTCHIEPSSNNELFPGTYMAECNSDGRLVFYSSGCTSEECTDSDGDGRCDLDCTSIPAFFSLLDPPDYPVQDPSAQDGYFSCMTVFGTGSSSDLSVTFAIFGNCSIPECQGVTSPPSSSPTPPAPAVTISPSETGAPSATPMPMTVTSSGSSHAAKVTVVIFAAAAAWMASLST